MKLVKLSIISFIGLFLFGLTGCTPPHRTETNVAFRLSAFELASRLGLQVTEETDRYIEMKNISNRVLVFLHEGGRVFVNSVPVGSTGPVVTQNGSVYLPEILENLIRPNLKSGYIAPKTFPTPKWSPPAHPVKKGLVVLDPGHGGKDPGTTSSLGFYEKGVNLKIASKVASLLKAKGIQVKMLRTSDIFIDKYDRADLANKLNPDLFVSIHCDANDSRATRGYSVWVCRSASQNSRVVAGIVEESMTKTGLSSRGVREGDYVVLTNTNCPSILVECGHLSNSREAALLYDGSFQDKIASAIAEGISNALSRL